MTQPTRRQFLKSSAAAAALPWARLLRAAAAADSAAPLPQPQQPAALRPNIVFILADDLGYADVGCYGQKRIRTPNIDRLAAEGMRFTDFYAGGAVCIPSRSCLMQGLHSGHTRHHGSNAHVPLEDADLTVAEVLRDAGYATACIGKWALGDDLQGPGAAHKQGWDYYFGEFNQTTVHSYYLPHMWEFDRDGTVSRLPPDKEMRKVPLPGNAGGARKEYSHDVLAEKALACLDARAAGPKPFFLYLPFTIPHADYDVPSLEPYANEDWPETEKKYAAMITRMDADIGRIVSRLKERGIDRSTLVIFTSDNGPTSGQGHRADFFQSAGPLRGLKASLYEGGIRVPFVARWPGKVPAGAVCRTPLAFWDFLPTAAELAGVAPPDKLDGISFVPALLGRPQPEHEFLYWESPRQRAVRMGRFKAILSGPDLKVDGLYDLAADVGEQTDLSAVHPEVAEKARAVARAAGSPPPEASRPEAPQRKATPKAKAEKAA